MRPALPGEKLLGGENAAQPPVKRPKNRPPAPQEAAALPKRNQPPKGGVRHAVKRPAEAAKLAVDGVATALVTDNGVRMWRSWNRFVRYMIYLCS